MKPIPIQTTVKRLLADVYTPVGIYLRLRDRYRDTILLESADHRAAQDSWSFIGVHAIAGIEISDAGELEYKLPGRSPEKRAITGAATVPDLLQEFLGRFDAPADLAPEARAAQGLYGYTSFDAVAFFESARPLAAAPPLIPLMRYRLYQYVIAINHFRDELFFLENRIPGIESDAAAVESLIRGRDVPVFPFRARGEESSSLTDEAFREMVRQGIGHCRRGDVFQLVLSRRFQQSFTGDDFNVYRALRSINPSPYLFYFDYGDYRLLGSSPESQLVIRNGEAIVHPIAGTFRRTGDEARDRAAAERLLQDSKENAEHVMLLDLARNDLSRHCSEVEVTRYREVQYFSHVIHLVSEVKGRLATGYNPFAILGDSFPAGTLSGAPKVKALELIARYEPVPRSFYGGAIGFMGFNGDCNHAIMIRTFLSRQNTLYCQAGAGVVVASDPESELQEVGNKLGALRKAITEAETIQP